MSSTIQSTKTPHRRRRKANAVDKENRGFAANYLLTVNDEEVSFEKAGDATDPKQIDSSTSNRAQTLQHFRDALSKTTEAMVFFQQRSNLDENVIICSLFPQSSVGLWHVQNHTAELLSLSRKLIKQTTQEGVVDGNNLLLIAVHCLRAVIALQDRDSNQESCIRLLYHLLTVTTKPEKSPMIVVAGLEALHWVLHNYSCLTNDGRVVHFFAGSLPIWPGAVLPSFTDDRTARGTMTLRQVVTIALKSCLACVSSVYQLWCQDASTPIEKGAPRRDQPLTINGSLNSILLGQPPHKDPLHFMRLLFQSCYYPWLSFVADCQDIACINDMTAHCKTAHKVIWDAAIKLKDKPAVFDARPTLEDYCLQLRGIAIEMLVPEAKSIQGRKVIQDHLWESALSYASKACSVHAQQVGPFPVAADSALAAFHRSVGSKLDPYHLPPSYPMPYVEYCAYRFLHCGIFPNLGDCCNPQCWKLDLRNENDAGSLILMLTMIGIRANHILNDTVNTDVFPGCCGLYLSNTDTLANNNLEELLPDFLSALLPKWDSLSAQTQYRYFQLFSTLSFHRSVFQTLRNDTQPFNVHALVILARVLTHCIGPLSLLVAKSCMDPTKKLAIFESALECYIRPLAAFERLRAMHDVDQASKYEMLANQTIFDIYQVFQTQDPVPTKLLEKCAKSISLVARQRSDANSTLASIYPALVAIPLYSHLAAKDESQGESTHQIPARLAHVANALQSVGLLSHAVVVFAVLLAHELPNCYSGDVLELEEIDLLRFLVSRSKNIFIPDTCTFQPTTLARSAIRRLISIISDIRSHPEQAEAGEQLKGAWETFLAGLQINKFLWDVIETKQENLLISTVLPRLLRLEQPSAGTFLQVFMLLVDVITELGASLQGSTQQHDTSWQMQDCNTLISYLQSATIPISLPSPAIHHALVLVVAATTFLDNKAVEYSKVVALENTIAPNAKNPTFPFSMKFSRDSLTLLKSAANIDKKNSVHEEFLCATIQHFCWQLEADHRCEATSVVFQQCQRAMDTFQSAPTRFQDTVSKFWSNAFIWTLSVFQNQLESMGDPTRSVIVMEWILDLLNEDDLDKSTWFRSMAISAFLASPLCKGDLNALLIPEAGAICPSTSLKWFAQKELHLSSLRTLITFGKGEPESSLMERVQDIHEEIQAAEGAVKPTVLLWWLCSGVELIFAELAASSGNFADALHHLQESCRLCLSVVSSTRGCAQPDGTLSTWENVAQSTLASRATRRYIELLCLRSKIYARTGDHRKAVAYLTNLSDYLGLELKRFDKDCGPNVEEMLSPDSGLRTKIFRRLSFDILCSAGAQDLVLRGLEQTGGTWLKSAWAESADESHQLQVILDVLSVGDLVYGESVNSSLQNSFSSFYADALDYYRKIVSNKLFETYRHITNDRPTSIGAKVAIREIRCLCHVASQLDSETRSRVRDLCNKVKANLAAETVDRVWAYYYEATMEIAALSQSGALSVIWSPDQREISDADNQKLHNARHLLSTAAAIHAIGSDILSRLILRNLALVTGPENGCTNSSCAGALVLSSIGQSFRQLMVRSLHNGRSDLSDLFNQSTFAETSNGILDHLAQVSPVNWKYVAATLCPSGELLITSIEKDSAGKISMETTLEEPKNAATVYDDVMIPLDVIINESQNQLFGMDPATISEQYVKEANKRAWWDTRYKLDERLRILLERVENNYFHSLHLRKDSNDCIFADTTPLPIGNLASKFEAAATVNHLHTPHRESDETLKKLTVSKLKDKLRSEYGFSDSSLRKMKKQELIDLILSQSDTSTPHTAREDNPKEGCLFLILDENLHRFPFEGMPSLVGQCVCRVPSLSFVMAILLDKGIQAPGETPLVDPCRASYVLDPESNLVSSRARLKPVLDNISSANDWEWDGVIGEIPPVSFMERGLCRRDSLFLYFGHGGGQTCYSRKQVENLISRRDGHEERACSATVVLMGCSSGRLVSVNRKHSQSLQQVPLYYEPEGIALSYLCAGAPCVVGNLWDVTDHDIDRFSTALLQQFLQADGTSSGESLASCVAKSREACKLRFIVGCAPVCYGVPVHLIN